MNAIQWTVRQYAAIGGSKKPRWTMGLPNQILDLLRSGALTRAQVLRHTGAATSAVDSALRRLVDSGAILRRAGPRRAMEYRRR